MLKSRKLITFPLLVEHDATVAARTWYTKCKFLLRKFTWDPCASWPFKKASFATSARVVVVRREQLRSAAFAMATVSNRKCSRLLQALCSALSKCVALVPDKARLLQLKIAAKIAKAKKRSVTAKSWMCTWRRECAMGRR